MDHSPDQHSKPHERARTTLNPPTPVWHPPHKTGTRIPTTRPTRPQPQTSIQNPGAMPKRKPSQQDNGVVPSKRGRYSKRQIAPSCSPRPCGRAPEPTPASKAPGKCPRSIKNASRTTRSRPGTPALRSERRSCARNAGVALGTPGELSPESQPRLQDNPFAPRKAGIALRTPATVPREPHASSTPDSSHEAPERVQDGQATSKRHPAPKTPWPTPKPPSPVLRTGAMPEPLRARPNLLSDSSPRTDVARRPPKLPIHYISRRARRVARTFFSAVT